MYIIFNNCEMKRMQSINNGLQAYEVTFNKSTHEFKINSFPLW